MVKILSILTTMVIISQCAILPVNDNTHPKATTTTTTVSLIKLINNSECPSGQVMTDGKGCVQACSKEILKECQFSLDDIFDGQVCGYDSIAKVWTTFGSRCMGCQTQNIVGFTYSKCQGEPTIDVGIPLTDANWKDVLPGVPICGQYEFYTKQKGCIKACTHPEFKKCPTNPVTTETGSKFCAYKINGNWANFASTCQACSSGSDYFGVIDGKCDNTVIVFNPPLPNTTATPPTLSSTKCKVDADCKATDRCTLGYCLNKCSGILCKSGTECINGNCVPIGQCKTDKNCGFSQTCNAGKCVSKELKCGSIVCKSDEQCVYNQCINNEFVVSAGCMTVKCSAGFICIQGGCVREPKKCKTAAQCGIGEKCGSSGTCVDKCSGVKCSANQYCVQGVCQVNACGKVVCPKGTYCKSGVCVPDIAVCPADTSYKTKVCTDPRPNEKTCPTVYYFRAPDPLFCGVRADGTRVNFPRECDACKDSGIVYYFDKPCHKAPFVCEKSDTCSAGGYCSAVCRVSQECPYDWQVCIEGRCVDQCATMRCAAGPCKFGQCQFVEASGACTLGVSSGCKKEQWSCVGFECADLCLRQACPAYRRCNPQSGACEVIPFNG